MIRGTLLFVLLAALMIAVAWIADRPGAVSIVWQGWRIDTSVPIVALFGPTLPERSMPWRDPAIGAIAIDAGPLPCRPCHQRTCVPGDFRCLTGISPNMVLSAARDLLAPARRSGEAAKAARTQP